MDPSAAEWVVPAIFAVLGPALFVLGIRQLVLIRRQQRTWLRYPGEAFDSVWRRGHQFWMLRWVDRDGVQRTARSPYGNSSGTLRSFPFPVQVLVDPTDPRQARVADGANSGGLFAVLLTLIGFFFGIIGCALLITGLLRG